MEITVKNDVSYMTCFASVQHVTQADYDLLTEKAGDVFYIHATTTLQPGFIVRFGAAVADHPDELESTLSELGFSSDLVALCVALHGGGYSAVHFDLDMDLLPGAPWYMETGTRVAPLAYDLPLLSWHDLDDAQKAIAKVEFTNEEDDAEDYHESVGTVFIYLPASDDNDAQLFITADCVRLDGSELGEHFDGVFSESAYSSIALKLSDDSEFVNLARVTG